MFLLLVNLALSVSFEASFEVKYTPSCPGDANSYLIVDNGIRVLPPSIYGPTFLDLEPGPHLIDVSHPWCTFFPVHFKLQDDGSFEAISNVSINDEYPVPIRHMYHSDHPFIEALFSPIPVLLIALPFAWPYLKPYMFTKEFLDQWNKKPEETETKTEEKPAALKKTD
jgi:hypothetical protein